MLDHVPSLTRRRRIAELPSLNAVLCGQPGRLQSELKLRVCEIRITDKSTAPGGGDEIRCDEMF